MSTGCRSDLSINHVGDHHNLVSFSIWKFQRKFGGLDVKSQHDGILETLKKHQKKNLETKVTQNYQQSPCCNIIHKTVVPVSPQDHLSGQFLVDMRCLCIGHCTSEPDRRTDTVVITTACAYIGLSKTDEKSKLIFTTWILRSMDNRT